MSLKEKCLYFVHHERYVALSAYIVRQTYQCISGNPPPPPGLTPRLQQHLLLPRKFTSPHMVSAAPEAWTNEL
jgi:hypothetical protein